MTLPASVAPRRVLAIVGSQHAQRTPSTLKLIEEILATYEADDFQVLTSGDAPGIDTFAAEQAAARGWTLQIYPAAVERWDGPGGFKERNQKIADACDALVRIALIGSATYGSGWTRDRAKAMGKPTQEFLIQR